MDAVAFGKAHLNFEEKSLIRAEQHEHRRARKNTTSCRSPTREIDTKSIKNELKEKRQLEFLKRRSMSPEMCGAKTAQRQKRTSPRIFNMRRFTSETVDTNQSNLAANGQPILERSFSDSPSSSKWTSLWSDPIKDQKSTSETQNSKVLKEKSTLNVRTTKIIRSERFQQKLTQQTELIQGKKMLREAAVQTESGVVTVKDTDLQKLADYLQEALWREEILQKKLASLQDSTANLMNSSDKIWTSRCSEDLLRNKIRALEAQLHVCLQKFPKDAVKKLFFQMERQKLIYEDKAVIALQKATQEKTEAVTKADKLQGALNTALSEAQRWQSLYEELRLSSERLRLKQDQSDDQLQQLHHQLELSRVREGEVTEELVSLTQHNQELQYSIRLLEQDNDELREELQQLRDGDGETEELLGQPVLTSKETEQSPEAKRLSEVEEQLEQTIKTLQLREKECEELQTDLSVMEQECQSTQSRLSQCREQLRQVAHRPRTVAGGCWCLCLPLMLLLAVGAVGLMLWLWFPPFREQLQDLYSDLHTRIEDYLLQMSSPQHSGCFRPV